MSTVTWKPARASSWDWLCCTACRGAASAAVVLVDSCASHCFVSETLVAKSELPVLPVDDIEVTLADRCQAKVSKTRLVPLVVCLAY